MVDAVFRCRYVNAATDITEYTDINMKHAGNILPCKTPKLVPRLVPLDQKKIFLKTLYRGPCYVLNGIIDLHTGQSTHDAIARAIYARL